MCSMKVTSSPSDNGQWTKDALEQNTLGRDRARKLCDEQFDKSLEQLKLEYPLAEQSSEQASARTAKIMLLCDSHTKQVQAINDKYMQNQEKIRTKLLEQMEQKELQFSQYASPFSRPMTYITIKFDTGLGNSLWICGNGPKMSWDAAKALPLRCVGTDTWVYETTEPFQAFSFKILLNGKAWETGQDHSVERNKPIEITPQF